MIPLELRGSLVLSQLEQPTVSEDTAETTVTFLLRSGSPELTQAWLGMSTLVLS